MDKFLLIERKHVPLTDIVLIEPYQPPPDSTPRSDRTYNARVVRLEGRPFLTQMTPQQFAEQHAFRILPADGVAINPQLPRDRALTIDIEDFVPTETFRPDKAYKTRLTWPAPHPDENNRWKLLLSEPKDVLAALHNTRPQADAGPDSPTDGATRPPHRRREHKGPTPANT